MWLPTQIRIDHRRRQIERCRGGIGFSRVAFWQLFGAKHRKINRNTGKAGFTSWVLTDGLKSGISATKAIKDLDKVSMGSLWAVRTKGGQQL